MSEIICGDCLTVMPTLDENSVDSIITDPPYHLASIVKRFGKSFEEDENYAEDTKKVNPYARLAKSGFMGKEWDSDIAFRVEVWQAALRVAKPGAILMAFGGTRTWHRLACAIEDAGWELRDTLMWLYGSGFPKSLDISKAIDKAAGAEREVVGVSDKQPAGFIRHGRTDEGVFLGTDTKRTPAVLTSPATDMAKLWQGWGTALKPAWEPIIVAMKPLEGTYGENAEKWGVAGLNIDGSRVDAGEGRPLRVLDAKSTATNTFHHEGSGLAGGSKVVGTTTLGRWPANLVLDEDSAALLDEQSDRASRFFYTAKASAAERNAGVEKNTHPTVKPVELMRYLCRLTKTPTGGVVLDPFMGSGTTGVACVLEHRDFIGIEIDEGYTEIARKRIANMRGPMFVESC